MGDTPHHKREKPEPAPESRDAAHRSQEITELEEEAMREAKRGTAESLDRALKAAERAAKLRRDSQT
ncbi:hypothetical protein ACX9I7_16015 [Streptomyces sp. L500]|uniref:hypothetical protein n=1 Tax=Streptomyces abikoensis TaxID=97398 RepID=UPI00167355D8|nr:hypothetical protein [Streptomyces abikoensis]GGP33509.1 hypothetical protein GCM10010214_01680 [Streptomyces abikoensis]